MMQAISRIMDPPSKGDRSGSRLRFRPDVRRAKGEFVPPRGALPCLPWRVRASSWKSGPKDSRAARTPLECAQFIVSRNALAHLP